MCRWCVHSYTLSYFDLLELDGGGIGVNKEIESSGTYSMEWTVMYCASSSGDHRKGGTTRTKTGIRMMVVTTAMPTCTKTNIHGLWQCFSSQIPRAPAINPVTFVSIPLASMEADRPEIIATNWNHFSLTPIVLVPERMNNTGNHGQQHQTQGRKISIRRMHGRWSALQLFCSSPLASSRARDKSTRPTNTDMMAEKISNTKKDWISPTHPSGNKALTRATRVNAQATFIAKDSRPHIRSIVLGSTTVSTYAASAATRKAIRVIRAR